MPETPAPSSETLTSPRARVPAALALAEVDAPAAPRPLPASIGEGDDPCSRYTIVRKLGEGGMGQVFEAREPRTGRRVAIKVMADGDDTGCTRAERFEREARAAFAAASEHVVAVLDAGRDAPTGARFLVMEHLEGEDLGRVFRRVGPLPADVAIRIGAQACRGLAGVHAQGIVHRDVKPANLFLASQGGSELCLKILDFGIAKRTGSALEPEDRAPPLTGRGAFLGSPRYVSPEQACGDAGVDRRTDLWSLGVVLYRALTGAMPFDLAGSSEDFIVEPLRATAPWVDPAVARAIEQALVVDPAGRYQSAEEMGEALVRFLPNGASIRAATLVPARIEEARRGR
jgi:eukaryotic-like serine/threonine-protein kinase